MLELIYFFFYILSTTTKNNLLFVFKVFVHCFGEVGGQFNCWYAVLLNLAITVTDELYKTSIYNAFKRLFSKLTLSILLTSISN